MALYNGLELVEVGTVELFGSACPVYITDFYTEELAAPFKKVGRRLRKLTADFEEEQCPSKVVKILQLVGEPGRMRSVTDEELAEFGDPVLFWWHILLLHHTGNEVKPDVLLPSGRCLVARARVPEGSGPVTLMSHLSWPKHHIDTVPASRRAGRHSGTFFAVYAT